jgi:cell division protein FtsB
MSDTGQTYSNLSSWRTTRYITYLTSFEARLALVQAQMQELLDSPVESYNFNSGDGGSQSANYRKLAELSQEEDRLLAQINKYMNLLHGGGLVQFNLRRK